MSNERTPNTQTLKHNLTIRHCTTQSDLFQYIFVHKMLLFYQMAEQY